MASSNDRVGKKIHRKHDGHHDTASADSVFSDEDGKKPNFFIRFLRKLALPSHEQLKRFNWRSVKAQFDLLDNYDECQKDIYMVESNEIDPVDCPYRIDDFLADIPQHAVGWSGVPSEVHSLYADPIPRGSIGRKKAADIPVEALTEEESLQLLEDLFHDVPNEEIAWAKLPTDLEILLEESLELKWKETDFTPELPKINNLLKKKLNKQMNFEQRKEYDAISFSEEDSSIGSYEEVEVHYDHFDLDGLSEDNLSNEDENWSDIEDIPEDKDFKFHDPTFFEELGELFGEKYRGDNEDDKEFIDVLSDTSSIFGDIPDQDYTEVKNTLDRMFQDMPEMIEVVCDNTHQGGIFAESNFIDDDEDIEVAGDIYDLLGDNTDDEIEIHSDQSSLYDTDSSDEGRRHNPDSKEYFENRKRRHVVVPVDEAGKDVDPIGLRKIQVLPPLELTDMELKDFVKLRFLNQKGKPLSTMTNILTPLENEIECLIKIAAEIRGYGKTEDDDEVEPAAPVENYPKLDGPTYAWANVSRQVSDAQQLRALTIDDRINIVPSHYSLELNVPKACCLHPIAVNDELSKFREPKSLKEYKLSLASLKKLRSIKKKRARSLKSRIFFFHSQKVRFFHKTSVGKALRKNTRYYKTDVHFPKNCRRCRVPLQESLVPITTPISAVFCCLFPILSAPCFYAHREFRCYICKEIYVLGDFKPPAEPTPEDREEKKRLDELREEKRILRRKFSNPKYS